MAERVAYVNGEIVPESKAVISAFDRGFRWGDGVYDVEATFRGKIFKLQQHIGRLYCSLRYTRIDPGLSKEEMTKITLDVLEANLGFLGENDDYTVGQVVSRGKLTPSRRMTKLPATVVVYCQPIAFEEFARFYLQGARVITPSIRRTPPQCISPKGKITNKMNHFLADLEVKEVDPDAYSLMLDINGNIAENASANFLFVSKGRIMVPDRRQVLQGITMETVLELADSLGIPWTESDYTPYDVYMADEAFLTSSSYCILPVLTLNGFRIGAKIPGPTTARLLKAWSDLVGVDIVARALSHLPEAGRELLSAATG